MKTKYRAVSFRHRLHTAIVIGATLVAVAGCRSSEVKTTAAQQQEVEQADLILVVNRNLYVDANVRNTFFQDGYAQRKSSIDKYEAFCRFSINYEKVGDADTTRIVAERMAVVAIRRVRDTANIDGNRYADANVDKRRQYAATNQIDNWVTRLVLNSPTQAWITGLDCEIFGSRSNHLTLDDIRSIIRPSMELIDSTGK